jgi:hypothetical protein
VAWGLLLSLGLGTGLFAQTKPVSPGKATPSPSPVAMQDGFASEALVGGAKLFLNGSGTRYKAIFKVYDMAFYTTRKVNTPQDAINLGGPKRLQFKALRELVGTDLGVLFIRGMKENTPPETFNKHLLMTNRLVEIFSARDKLMPGDTFAMDYIPSQGTTFYFQEVAQGDPLGDAEFFSMVLKIWLGDAPADFKLKDALLGVK